MLSIEEETILPSYICAIETTDLLWADNVCFTSYTPDLSSIQIFIELLFATSVKNLPSLNKHIQETVPHIPLIK